MNIFIDWLKHFTETYYFYNINQLLEKKRKTSNMGSKASVVAVVMSLPYKIDLKENGPISIRFYIDVKR